ncbi:MULTISPECIES: acetate--CoA ligase family protein [Bhargavaea]|uniref:Acetate--CoA ligase family protein n=1 Tax=Bhargavaea changchunensis TaxID=2134037 RepID=A0ABW2NHI3_9BACL|nr:acetate--CoA ligase family protein [Bhargavaea sp. CC-171006]
MTMKVTSPVEKENDFSSFLKPESIAIIGASNDPGKISGRPIEYLLRYGYEGKIYPVNPKYDSIQGLKSYRSIQELPMGVDLAIIAIGAKYVVQNLKACIEKQVKSCMIFSSGFAEMGEEGRKLQEEISVIAAQSGLFIIGPNCQGLANLKQRSITSFSTAFVEGDLVNGSSAILSQSGAVAAMVYNMQKEEGTGIKYWASTGNESDINIPRIATYILEDDDINMIQIYMESIKDGEELIDLGKKSVELDKPVLVLKPGKSEEAQKAASSHTGALAAEDAVINKAFDQFGLVRVDDVNELSSFSKVFRLDKRVKGKNVAILSNSGGLGVMMVDKCKEFGLNLAEFEEETIKRLEGILPIFASFENPIDVTAQLLNDKELLSNALPILMDDPNVDIILFGLGIIGKGYDIDTIMGDIIEAQSVGEKLIGVAWVGSQKGKVEIFNKNDVPAFEDPSLCVKAFAKYAQYCIEAKGNSTINDSITLFDMTELLVSAETHNGFMSEYDSKRVLKDNFPIGKGFVCGSSSELLELSEQLNFPVVLKVNSPKIQHKSDIGGVKLNIKNKQELLSVYSNMKSNELLVDGNGNLETIVEEMADSGFEISLGMKKDPVFGPVIMVASGGVFIEVLKDFQLLIPPISNEQAKAAIENLMMFPVMKGARGSTPKDIDSLVDVVVKFSQFVVQNEAFLEEIDLNPVIVHEEGKGVTIVDALIKNVRSSEHID